MRTVPVTHSDFGPLTSAQMPYPAITLAELEERSISLEESERRIEKLIHDFYHPKA